jgi:hypothetical protein
MNEEEEVKYKHLLTKEEKLESWGEGEWVLEPDEALFEWKGIKCSIIRLYDRYADGRLGKTLGNLCGYIQLPNGHEFEGKDIFSDEVSIEVHGSLSYLELEKDGHYWMGFDCAHSGDIAPGLEAFKLQDEISRKIEEKRSEWLKERNLEKILFCKSYKNMKFCIEECKSLAQQITGDKKTDGEDER